MYRKILLGGVTAAAIIGAGGTALALTGSDAPTPGTGSSSSSSQHAKKDATKDGKHGKHGKHGDRAMLRRLAYGQFVTKGKDGTFVTHDLINGTVTSVSSTSITVQAADKKSETFVVNKDTKVRERTMGQHKKGAATSGDKSATKGSDATISDIAKGDHVMVAGTGTSTYTAKHVVEIKGAK